MTKTLTFSLLVAASLGLAACSQSETNEVANDSLNMTDDVTNTADAAMNDAGNAFDNVANGFDNVTNNAM